MITNNGIQKWNTLVRQSFDKWVLVNCKTVELAKNFVKFYVTWYYTWFNEPDDDVNRAWVIHNKVETFLRYWDGEEDNTCFVLKDANICNVTNVTDSTYSYISDDIISWEDICFS